VKILKLYTCYRCNYEEVRPHFYKVDLLIKGERAVSVLLCPNCTDEIVDIINTKNYKG